MRARFALIILILSALTAGLAACGTAEDEPAPAPAPTVVGYFAGWGTYARDFQVKDLETSGAAGRLTHLLYAFGKVTGGRCQVADRWGIVAALLAIQAVLVLALPLAWWVHAHATRRHHI